MSCRECSTFTVPECTTAITIGSALTGTYIVQISRTGGRVHLIQVEAADGAVTIDMDDLPQGFLLSGNSYKIKLYRDADAYQRNTPEDICGADCIALEVNGTGEPGPVTLC
jgi:hypothetical protein